MRWPDFLSVRQEQKNLSIVRDKKTVTQRGKAIRFQCKEFSLQVQNLNCPIILYHKVKEKAVLAFSPPKKVLRQMRRALVQLRAILAY